MKLFRRLSPALLLLMLFAFSPEVRADDVVVTGGGLSTGDTTGGRFTFTGVNFSFSGGVGYGPSTCGPCVPGQQRSISNFNVGLDIYGGAATYNGVNFARVNYEGQLRFTGSFLVPTDGSLLVTLTTPFTFTGFLRGCTGSVISNCQGEVFSTSLSGQGFATLQLTGVYFNGGVLYSLNSVSYDFQPTAAVPEPATILLLGSGLAGAAASVRRRRRKASGGDGPTS